MAATRSETGTAAQAHCALRALCRAASISAGAAVLRTATSRPSIGEMHRMAGTNEQLLKVQMISK
jgi:hypothetical protein